MSERLEEIRARVAFDRMHESAQFDALAEMYHHETGNVAPGKDAPIAFGAVDRSERVREWRGWLRHDSSCRHRQAVEDRAWLLDRVEALEAEVERCDDQNCGCLGTVGAPTSEAP